MNNYFTIKPKEVHPSHDVREEGVLITDPVCQNCRCSAWDHQEALKQPCRPSRT